MKTFKKLLCVILSLMMILLTGVLPVNAQGTKEYDEQILASGSHVYFLTDFGIDAFDSLLHLNSDIYDAGFQWTIGNFNVSDGKIPNLDFNDDGGGKYINMGVIYENAEKFDELKDTLITGVVVYRQVDKSVELPRDFYWEGKRYHPVTKFFTDSDGNLNQGREDGVPLFLYYTSDGAKDGAPVLEDLAGYAYKNPHSSDDYVCGITIDKNGNVSSQKNQNMNETFGEPAGKYVYLEQEYHKHNLVVHYDKLGHWYTCTECSYKSTKQFHDRERDEACSVCGFKCNHENGWTDYGDTRICSVCDYQCDHKDGNMSNGFCSVCGFVCSHTGHCDDNGRCVVCGFQCDHSHGWVNGRCPVCRVQCPHPDNAGGYCNVCKWYSGRYKAEYILDMPNGLSYSFDFPKTVGNATLSVDGGEGYYVNGLGCPVQKTLLRGQKPATINGNETDQFIAYNGKETVNVTFVGWAGEDGTMYSIGDKPELTKDTTFYAVWETDAHSVTPADTCQYCGKETHKNIFDKIFCIFHRIVYFSKLLFDFSADKR